MDSAKKVIHLIPNAHLDPVYLWDWREGFNESMCTFQTMAEMLENDPELTFVHGEAQSYEPVEQYAPELFERIRALVAAGRWELVGNSYVQSDDNFPDTITFLKQFQRGRLYFQEKFGISSTVAWSPDAAGHAAGLPEIFQTSGLRYFSFSRPPTWTLALDNPAFVWQGRSGAEVLCCRAMPAYLSERNTTGQELEKMMSAFLALPQQNFMFCIGLGDHGGGTSVQQITELREVRRQHPEWEIRFSTLNRFFDALDAERSLLPVRREEINFTLRGVHTANAKIKHKFRDLETAVTRATRSCAVIHRALGLPPANFAAEWDDLFFNTFHDILPGDGIERSNCYQLRHMDAAIHRAEHLEFAALDHLIQHLDMPVPPAYAPDAPTEVPYLFFNPRPMAFHGYTELEGMLDYRPHFEYSDCENELPYDIRDEHRKSLPYQPIDIDSGPFENPLPWRKRVLLPLDIPPFGYRILYFGMCEKLPASPSATEVAAPAPNQITNGIYTVTAEADRLHITRRGQPVFNRDGLEFANFRDRYGCWGAMNDAEEAWTCREKTESWRIVQVKILEAGPYRSSMFVGWKGGQSLMYLTVSLTRDIDAVDFRATLNWSDRGIRLRMLFDRAETVTYQVPGGEVVRRNVLGDVPGQRWLEAGLTTGLMGLASDHFSGFSAVEDYFSVIMLRGTFVASDALDVAQSAPERPPCDLGEHHFQWSLTAAPGQARELAERIEYPPYFVQGWKHRGRMIPCSLSVAPDCVRLLDAENRDGRMVLTLQNCSAATVHAEIEGDPVVLSPWQILKLER